MPNHLQNSKWTLGGPKMADRVLKSVYPLVFGLSRKLSLNKFFDPSTPSMRKGNSGGKEKRRAEKRLMRIVATKSLPAVNRPNADCWNAACSCQNNSSPEKFQAGKDCQRIKFEGAIDTLYQMILRTEFLFEVEIKVLALTTVTCHL